MSNLQHWQSKIQENRKNTPRREYLMQIVSWMPLGFGKNSGYISRYPQTERSPMLIPIKEFHEKRNSLNEPDLKLPEDANFFDRVTELLKSTPLSPVIDQGGNESCEYSDTCLMSKNAYLSSVVIEGCENVLYSFCVANNAKNVYNSNLVIQNSEYIYQSTCVSNSNTIFYSRYIANSSNLWFCSNCVGCHDCILSDGLNNCSYYIRNVQYTKEEYHKLRDEILNKPQEFENLFSQVPIEGQNMGSVECEGNYVAFSNNVSNGYFVDHLNKGHNVMYTSGTGNTHDFYDCFDTGVNSNNFYAAEGAGVNGEHYYCVSQIEQCSNMFYSYYCVNCSFCLGCVGLKNQSYCILNKQYTKEERLSKVDEIFGKMDADGSLGSFFPPSMNPFYFNDTAAYLIDDSFTKEEVTAAGYLWRDDPIKVDIPQNADIISSLDLGELESFNEQGNRVIDSDILKKVIQDQQGNYYRIIPMEYKFLMKYGLPLPRKHWLERMKENFRIS